MTREQLHELQYRCNVAALRAIDAVLSEELGHRHFWIGDGQLPDLLPTLDRAIEAALRKHGQNLEDAT
jgi:hypothetical protein